MVSSGIHAMSCPDASVTLAPRIGYAASRMRARSVSCPQSNSWLPNAAACAAQPVEERDDRPAEAEVRGRGALELIATVQ